MSKARKALYDLLNSPWDAMPREEAEAILLELVERDEPMMYITTNEECEWIGTEEDGYMIHQWQDCICKACGWKVDEESSIFCNVCGQRFRDELDEETS